jgi:uncharacterized SAM-binding protein YcdF (DUF218 family)
MLRTAVRDLGAVVLGLYLMAFTPIPNVMTKAYRVDARVEPADAIVVLGGGVDFEGTLSISSLVRVTHALVLHGQGAAPTIVFSGAGSPGRPSNADAAVRLALSLGVPASAMVIDGRGRTTHEEAEFLGPLMRARGIRRILLVTGGLHLRRAVPLFERAGFVVLPAPADPVPTATDLPEERLGLVRDLAEELTAGAYYRLAGYL